MNNFHAIAVSALFLGTVDALCYSQDLPVARRVLTLSPTVMGMADKVTPLPVAGGSGTVLVIFRISEQGRVVDMRSTGGSPEMQRSSEAALLQWKFGPMRNGGGQPMEVFSAVIFDFSTDHPGMTTPKPMTANQLSPALGYPCSNAIAHQTPDAVSLCWKQLDAIVKDPKSTKMEQFTAYDEYGVVLLNAAQKPDLAIEQFTHAIDLAPSGLKPSDGEWAYVYWHRGIAESRAGNQIQAKQDIAAATESLKQAEAAIGKPGSYYYRELEERLARLVNSSQ